jgi:hypothetical protein
MPTITAQKPGGDDRIGSLTVSDPMMAKQIPSG